MRWMRGSTGMSPIPHVGFVMEHLHKSYWCKARGVVFCSSGRRQIAFEQAEEAVEGDTSDMFTGLAVLIARAHGAAQTPQRTEGKTTREDWSAAFNGASAG